MTGWGHYGGHSCSRDTLEPRVTEPNQWDVNRLPSQSAHGLLREAAGLVGTTVFVWGTGGRRFKSGRPDDTGPQATLGVASFLEGDDRQ